MSSTLIGSSIPRDVFPITPHNTDDNKCHGVICKGSAGNIVIETDEGDADRTYPIAAGEILVCKINKVKATGTTATTLWGFRLF